MLETARVTTASFETFIASAEPRLRRAFVARFGVEHGNDVTADVLAYAWEHWETLAATANPIGYLYRVQVEPGLGAALSRLSDDQRVAVILVHSYGTERVIGGGIIAPDNSIVATATLTTAATGLTPTTVGSINATTTTIVG